MKNPLHPEDLFKSEIIRSAWIELIRSGQSPEGPSGNWVPPQACLGEGPRHSELPRSQ